MNLQEVLENIKNLELDNQKKFLIIFTCAIIIYCDYAFILKMQLHSLKAINPRITQLKKDLDNLNKELADMQGLKERQAKEPQKAVTAAKKIIPEDQIPLLLQDISTAATKNDVRVIKMQPAKQLQVQPAKQEKTAQPADLNQLFIILDLSGDYHHLISFINDLENAPNFMAVESLKITQREQDYLRQSVSLVLKTYARK